MHRLLGQRCSVNARSRHGDTPLMLAVRAAGAGGLPHLEVVRALLERGAMANAADGVGETALMEAVCMGDRGLCRLLLQFRADPMQASMAGARAEDFRESEHGTLRKASLWTEKRVLKALRNYISKVL